MRELFQICNLSSTTLCCSHSIAHLNFLTYSMNIELTSRRSNVGTDEDFDEDNEEYDENFVNEQMSKTVWDDFMQALYDVRLSAPFIALLGILLAYHLTIAPYQTTNMEVSDNFNDLVSCCPSLSDMSGRL